MNHEGKWIARILGEVLLVLLHCFSTETLLRLQRQGKYKQNKGTGFSCDVLILSDFIHIQASTR